MENGLDFLNPHESIPDPFDSLREQDWTYQLGEIVFFDIKDMMGEFEDMVKYDEEQGNIAIAHNEQQAIIVAQSLSQCEEGETDKDCEYYDIEFGDGTVLVAVSGYHLD